MAASSDAFGDSGDVERWLREARAGSQEALGHLFQLCRHYLLLVANKELDPMFQAKVAASDVVQDSLLEAGRDFLRFRGQTEEELLGWLRSILGHNLANVRRHYQETGKRSVAREVPFPVNLDESPPRSVLHGGETPSTPLHRRERDEALERALQQLPEHYRQVIVLREWDRRTFEEIGGQLGRSAEAARKLWVRALEELGSLLAPPDASG
jgi:RNA polymerase sigma-70 factor (ECF subfamily)